MKHRKMNKKLSIKKATVANLQIREMRDARGGAITLYDITCPNISTCYADRCLCPI